MNPNPKIESYLDGDHELGRHAGTIPQWSPSTACRVSWTHAHTGGRARRDTLMAGGASGGPALGPAHEV